MSVKSDNITKFTLPYHPQYGIPDTTRVEVLRAVVDWRITVKDAARIYKLHTTTVYKWLRAAKKGL